MLPLKDDAPRLTTPYINYFLIAANIIVFIFEIMPPGLNATIGQFGLIPGKIPLWLSGSAAVTAGAALLPIFTSMFLHAGFWHLAGNMWFLRIFGDNVEDQLGHFGYLLFYLVAGAIAAATHIVFNFYSLVPTAGASGAIAGVMGAYFILFPSARVLTWFFVFFLWLPAWVMLGYWFVVQFLTGAANAINPASTGGGVAFGAHVGGFIAGVVMIKLLPLRPRRYRYGH